MARIIRRNDSAAGSNKKGIIARLCGIGLAIGCLVLLPGTARAALPVLFSAEQQPSNNGMASSIWESDLQYAAVLIILAFVGAGLILSLLLNRFTDKKHVEQIKKRDRLISTVNNVASVMLSENSGMDFTASLKSGMGLMGQLLNVDRVHILQNEMIDGELCAVQKHVWLSEAGSHKAPPSNEVIYRYSIAPEWRDKFIKGESICNQFAVLSLQEQNFLSCHHVKSMVLMPLFLHDEFWGLFGIDACMEERMFTEDEINILHSASLMMVNAININAMTQSLQATANQLEAALLEANYASTAKSAFIANLSHEIRTPMNSIIGFSELAMDGNITPETKEYLENIIKNSNWLLTIINDILDMSKIEANKMVLENVPLDLHDIFVHCQTLILPKAIEKGLILHFYAEPVIGKKLLGDPTRIHQILINLLSNAIKFSNIGAVKLSSFITNMDEDTCTVCFEVRDSGIGMTAQQIEDIFKPFTQADGSTTRKHGGTGLGLSITKNLVELMGGHLSVESTVKVGSKFSFELTFDTMETLDTEPFQTVFVELEKPMFEGTVLVCEDNVMNQRVIFEHLQRVGLNVEMANNGKIGVDRVRSRKEAGLKPYDIILMDIHMPVMDGLEAVPLIIELDTGAPVIATTANIMTDDLNLYKESGMIDYLAKPFTTQELWRCLLRHLVPIDAVQQNGYAMELDEELKKQLVTTFLKENQTRYAQITAALSAGDMTLAHRLAHNLKNSASLVEKQELSKAAQAVESALTGGVNAVMDEQMRTLNNELTAALAAFDTFIPLAESVPLKESSNGLMGLQASLAILDKLKPLLKSGNPECLDFIDELKRMRGSEKLVEYMEAFRFRPEALGAFETLMRELEGT
ncbi:MAG: ATP-binding protein [Clostridia bacterium]|nr:ATP-binding protein [Clostridia bacterium]